MPPADLAEIVRRDGLRNGVEQGAKHLQQELGWADWMVRSDQAIRRPWQVVCCACSFCWPRGSPRPAHRLARSPHRNQRTPAALLTLTPPRRRGGGEMGPARSSPPPALRALLDAVGQGCPLDLYVRV